MECTHQLTASETTATFDTGHTFSASSSSGAAVSATKHAGSISIARVTVRMNAAKFRHRVKPSAQAAQRYPVGRRDQHFVRGMMTRKSVERSVQIACCLIEMVVAREVLRKD